MSQTNVTTTSYSNNLILSNKEAVLFGLSGYNSGPAQFIHLHDATSLPADTAIPEVTFSVPANSNFSIDYELKGRYFVNGIVICNSTTCPTKTIGLADCWFDAQVV